MKTTSNNGNTQVSRLGQTSFQSKRFRRERMRSVVGIFWAVLAFHNQNLMSDVIDATLWHDDRERNYLLHVPSSYESGSPMPLVLALHGMGQNGHTQMNASRMNEVSEREGFLVAYPSALQGSWSSDTPDINLGFFDDLLDNIRSNYSIDESRIYSTGLSQGAVRSYMLAVERPNVFAAIAPVAGVRPLLPDGDLFPAGLPNLPEQPLPMLHIHGTSDSVVPIEGGSGISMFPSVEEVLDEWASHNGCDPDPILSELPDERPSDRRSVTLHTFAGCTPYTRVDGDEKSADVLFYQVNQGGHEWPRSPTLDASSVVWNFFSQHSRPMQATLLGDFNRDGSLDSTDIDILSASIGSEEVRFDLNQDGFVNHDDRAFWVFQLKQTNFGDANLDGHFDSSDLVQVFQQSEYEDSIARNSGWSVGDWNGDQEFDSGDLVLAFQSGGYETQTISTVATVPESSSITWVFLGWIGLYARYRKR